ncbi:MAG: O-antigen ligase family protein [Armatimonadota bacterium]
MTTAPQTSSRSENSLYPPQQGKEHPAPFQAFVKGIVPWLVAALAAACLAVCIVLPKIGAALVVLVSAYFLLRRILQRPLTGIYCALWIFPIYPLLRAANVAYGIPIAVPGTRPWCEGILLLVFAGLVLGGISSRHLRFAFKWDDLPVYLFFLSGVYGTVVDLTYLSPVVPFFGWLVSLTGALFYVAIRWIRPDKAQVQNLLRVFIVTYAIGAVFSLFEYFVRLPFMSKLAMVTRPVLLGGLSGMESAWRVYPRLQSLLFDENVWGTLSTFVALYCLATRMIDRPRRASRGWWLLFLLAMINLVLTMSRGALIAFVVSIAVLLMIRGRHRLRLLAAVTAALTIAGIVIVSNANDRRMAYLLYRSNTISSSNLKNGSAVDDRAFQWKQGWEIFELYPSGKGLGTVGFAAFLSKGGSNSVADGIYFRVLAETGVPGTLLFVSSLAGVGIVLAKRTRGSVGSVRMLGMTLFAFHIGFCVQSIGANTYDYYYVPALFWLLFGCFVSLAERQRLDRPQIAP